MGCNKLKAFLQHCLLVTMMSGAHAAPEVLIEAPGVEVTVSDLEFYLSMGPPAASGSKWGSKTRVNQAISDLYALRLLAADSLAAGLVPPDEANWLAEYEVAMLRVRRLLAEKVSVAMAETDWEAEAREAYLASRDSHTTPETVTVRALFLNVGCRSEEATLALAAELTHADMTFAEFESVVTEHTEDQSAKLKAGLMVDVKRGDTVAPFEQAAFALTVPGSVSAPLVSEYGVHVVQLIERVPSRRQSFAEVKEQIIAELKPIRYEQYRSNIQDEARTREPEGFRINEAALQAIYAEALDGL